MELQFASITDEDINFIIATAENGVMLSELTQHSFFGEPVQFLKLTTVLYMIQEIEQIFHIAGAVSESKELRDLAELEFLLSVGNVVYPFVGAVSSGMQACLNLTSSYLAVSDDEVKSLALLCRIQIIKHAAVASNWQLIRTVCASFSETERQFAEDFLVSVARMSAWFFDGSQARFEHEKWLNYCKVIDEHVCETTSVRKTAVQACIANLAVSMGDIEEAERILERNSSIDARSTALVRMRRAIKDKDFEAASSLADQLILLPSQNAMEVAFPRDVAENVLRRVNSILLSAGLKPFVISGTLLGLVREGRIFEHDKDFDIGILGWEKQFDVASALIKTGEFAFSARDLRGVELYTLAVRHVSSNITFDIFFFHDRGDHFLHGIDHRIGYTLHYKFSKFELISRDFIGENFLIPGDYPQMLTENYGSDWSTPKPNYFVRLQSPALVRDNHALFGFIARHEMLDLLAKRSSLAKANALIDCIVSNVPQKFQPKKRMINEFLRAFGGRAQ
jgi:hypothetical protein